MKQSLFFVCFIMLVTLQPLSSNATGLQAVTSPESFFGFHPGADRKMFSYASLMGYLKRLERESDRIRIDEIGQSELGRPMYLVFVSSPENIKRLEELKEINRRLALDPNIPDQERKQLIEKGRAFVLVTLSMHSNEVGPSQAAPLMAYNLITNIEPDMQQHLENVVFMMVPSHNPDGHDMMVDHYNKYLGTPFEGSTLPGVYHRYVGHNINRDFITLAMRENQVVSEIYSKTWHPHVVVEKHQMGMSGVRYFVPPYHDPIAQNIDPTLWNWSWVLGSAMSRDMTAKGLQGVSQHYLFDNYWPGHTTTSLWKNSISLLTEAASAHLATPVYVELGELGVSGKGLSEYKKSTNMPDPWLGGRWGLPEIVKYEVESVYPLIRTASRQKNDILLSRNDLVRREVNRGKTVAPFFYVLPSNQHDKSELYKLLQLMHQHGVSVYKLQQDAVVGRQAFNKGDYVIPMAQPFRPFIKEVMEVQQYPVRHYTPGGEMIEPYDITSWSLPLHRGVTAVEINHNQPGFIEKLMPLSPEAMRMESEAAAGEFLVFNGNFNESFLAAFNSLARGVEVFRNASPLETGGLKIPAGSFLIRQTARHRQAIEQLLQGMVSTPRRITSRPEGFTQIQMPRIALVETWLHDMDAGWARFLFDSYGIPFTVVRPSEIKDIDLNQRFDVVIFADSREDQLMYGQSRRGEERFIPFYPEGYAVGMGREGWQNVLDFIINGGNVLSWGRSVDLFTGIMEPRQPHQQFRFPVNNVSRQLTGNHLNVPGSLLAVNLIPNHPLTLGMPLSIGVFHRENPILETNIPSFGMNRRVIASFPEENILLSGFAKNEKLLSRSPAMVWMQKGKGQVVLYSFAPNFRGSTQVTHKLIFNALLLRSQSGD